MDSPDVEELEALLEAEEAIEAHCRRLLTLARARIRELEAGLVLSCESFIRVSDELDAANATITDQTDQIAKAATELAACSQTVADDQETIARLTAGLEHLQQEIIVLLHPTTQGVTMTVTFDPPTKRSI